MVLGYSCKLISRGSEENFYLLYIFHVVKKLAIYLLLQGTKNLLALAAHICLLRKNCRNSDLSFWNYLFPKGLI